MKRVVVTGCGVVSPVGLSTKESWENILKGRSGVGKISLFDTTNFKVSLAAEARNFDPVALLGRRAARRQDRFEQMANVAVNEALAQSGLEITEDNRYRIGHMVSCAFGGIMSIVEQTTLMNAEGPNKISPFGLSKFMTTSSSINITHDLRGPSMSMASACATGADGIGVALQFIRGGLADAMLAGGADAPIASLTMGAFDRMRAYSHRTDGSPSPFSADRDGLVLGEGAGVLMLESLEHAQARGADILAEVAGYGATNDAFHMTAPLADGAASAQAFRQALENAEINIDEVDHVNAHGTGTQMNDGAETQAIKRVLGEHAYDIPVSATKSMTGHMMGAAGAVEAIFAIQAIRENVAPPTINHRVDDPECDLDYVLGDPQEREISVAVSNAFGFGGHNSVLVFKTFNG